MIDSNFSLILVFLFWLCSRLFPGRRQMIYSRLHVLDDLKVKILIVFCLDVDNLHEVFCTRSIVQIFVYFERAYRSFVPQITHRITSDDIYLDETIKWPR
jgi:hypothetical protein